MDFSTLDTAVNDYIITRNIMSICNTGAKARYEYHNCLERWVLSMLNSAPHTDRIYREIERDLPFNRKLLSELIEKKMNDPDGILEKVIMIVNSAMHNDCIINNTPAISWAFNHNLIVDIGREVHITINMSQAKAAELKMYPDMSLALLALRYEAILNRGQQWSIPKSQYQYMYDKYGVRFEGFASPLNSGLSDMIDGKYCSIFENDKTFGAIGNFFEQNLYPDESETHRHWVINPPFSEPLMDNVVDKIFADLTYANAHMLSVMVILVMPSWTDFGGYIKIANSEFLRHVDRMGKKGHFYEHQGKSICVSMKSTMFVLDTGVNDVSYTDIAKHMRQKRNRNRNGKERWGKK